MVGTSKTSRNWSQPRWTSWILSLSDRPNASSDAVTGQMQAPHRRDIRAEMGLRGEFRVGVSVIGGSIDSRCHSGDRGRLRRSTGAGRAA
jgi:hypothetical protein